MKWNRHFALPGAHAFLSASKYHWLGYDDDKFDRYFEQAEAAREGTEMHNLAAELIRKKVKVVRNNKTFNMYVNDGIGYRMTPEQLLFYSENCFGTADCISFSERKGRTSPLGEPLRPILRVSDLKMGVSPTSEKQLLVYAAIFCLEYEWDPHEIDIELRIYQNDEVREYEADGADVKYIMDKIRRFDERIKLRRLELEGI